MILPIVRVVVHPDGALVTRQGPLRPEADGVEIRKLPLMLDPTTVRVRIDGAEIAEIRTEIDLLDEDRAASPALFDEVRAAGDALALTDAEIAAARRIRAATADLAPGFANAPEAALPSAAQLGSWLAADRAVADRIAEIDARLRDLSDARRREAEALAVLEHRLAQESSEQFWQRWEPTRRVRVRTARGPDGEDRAVSDRVDVELSYRIPGATWSPAYTLDADAALREGRFAMRATVVQATGEDWSGVELALCSAPSERHVDVPDLDALRLGTHQPRPPTGWRPLPPDLDGLFPDLPSEDATRSGLGGPQPDLGVLSGEDTGRGGGVELDGVPADLVDGDGYDELELERMFDDDGPTTTMALPPPAPPGAPPPPRSIAMPLGGSAAGSHPVPQSAPQPAPQPAMPAYPAPDIEARAMMAPRCRAARASVVCSQPPSRRPGRRPAPSWVRPSRRLRRQQRRWSEGGRLRGARGSGAAEASPPTIGSTSRSTGCSTAGCAWWAGRARTASAGGCGRSQRTTCSARSARPPPAGRGTPRA